MDARSRALCRALGYEFKRPETLTEAVTHPSVGSRGGRPSAFERLEFLGDRVLGLAVAEMLLRTFPDEVEGDLARRLVALVRREALARVARTVGIGNALILAPGEDDGALRDNAAVLADTCEAVLGAIFLDGGMEAAAKVVRAHWEPLVAEAAAPPRDAKTALQEWALARGMPLPVYSVVTRAGSAHEPSFIISVSVAGQAPEQGTGTSKRAAEQAAAAALLARVIS